MVDTAYNCSWINHEIKPVLKSCNSDENERYISTRRRSWIVLPVPDLPKQGRSRSMDFTSKTKTGKMDRRVSFGEIQMRHYTQTVGDHPCTDRGPPISLDWMYKEGERIPVDEYEAKFESKSRRKPTMLSVNDRRNILMQEYGYDISDIKAAIRERIKTAHQRKQSAKATPVMKLEKTMKYIRSNAKHILHLGTTASSAA